MYDSTEISDKNSLGTKSASAWDLGAYEPHNHISKNRKLIEQFNYFLSHFRSESLSIAALRNYFDQDAATKYLGVQWFENPLTWPVAYNQSNGVVQIHPVIFKLVELKPLARLFILTEIFDQVIYAQLHRQLLDPELNTPLEENQKIIVPQLLRIKLAKQQLIEQNRFFSESEPQVILDPYCAWNLAIPQHVASVELAQQDFNRAIAVFNAQHKRVSS